MRIDPQTDRTMLAQSQRSARRPWLRLLSSVMELAGGQARLLRHTERAWASVTFTGTRHGLVLAFSGAEAITAAESFIAALPEHEFAIPRQIVADASVVSVEHHILPAPYMEVEAEILLIEDC